MHKIDSYIGWKLWKWAKRRHPKKTKNWIRERYWSSIGNRPQYYQAIEAARKANDSGAFIEFTFSALLSIIEIQTKVQNKQLPDNEDGTDKFGDKFGESVGEFGDKFGEMQTQEKIVALMRLNPKISAKALGEAINLTTRGIEKSISALKKAGGH